MSGAVATLGLGTELASGQTVTLDYAHDDDAPLKRAADGGDHAPGFTGQAVDMSLLNPLGPPQNFAVIAEPGELNLLATWDAVEGATSYQLRWRKSGGEFEAANATTVTDPICSVTVLDYGQWEVRLQGCNDAACGPEAVAAVEAVQAGSLRLERAVDDEGEVRPRTLTASWDPVEGASSYTLGWQRLGGNLPAQEQAQSVAARQSRAVSTVSLSSEQSADAQTANQLTLSSDRTSTDLTLPDGGAYRVELQARGESDDLIALAHGHVDQAPGQPDTTPPRLEWGEIDGDVITLHFSEPLDETAVGGHFGTFIRTWGGWVQNRSSNIQVSGNKVTVRGNPRAETVSTPWGHFAGVRYHPPIGSARGIRDLAGNRTTYFHAHIQNVTGRSYVTDVALSSDPGDDGPYASGDTIRMRVTFRKDVNVTGTPRLKIDFDPADGGEKWANYASGNGTRKLEFTYTVVSADISTEGVAVLENTLELNGGTIRGAPPGPADDARLAHVGLRHNSAHKVVTWASAAPVLLGASVTGTALSLTFSEPLGAAGSLANGAFTVKKTPQGGSEEAVSLSGSPAISGSTLTLTLAGAVLDTDAGVKVSYAKPPTGANNKLVDAGGAVAADFTDESVKNTLDTTKPELLRGEIDGDVITLFFSEQLDEETLGKGDYYTIRLQYLSLFGGAPHHGRCRSGYPGWSISTLRPRDVHISGSTVTVVGLEDDARYRAGVGQNHNGFYYVADVTTPADQRLRDVSGNPVITTSGAGRYRYTEDITLENVTRLPYPKSAAVNGSRLTLTFSAPMDGSSKPAASVFTVKVNGSAVGLASANPVSVAGREVTLILAVAVTSGDAVTVSYALPSASPLQNVICEDAPSFTDQAVTNATP